MRNPTGKKLEKIIFKLFDDASQGVDRYNHNDSLWLIFTNEMKWVVEFTKDQTLWYNYNFFKNEMELIGLDCVEDKDFIQKWFESRFLDIPKVEDTKTSEGVLCGAVEDTIQNGVKHTVNQLSEQRLSVEDTIQNGVKHTLRQSLLCQMDVEDTIQNGVKHTELSKRDFFPKDTVQNGVKHTVNQLSEQRLSVEDTVQNGVKETIGTLRRTAKWGVDDIIQNGVKNTVLKTKLYFGQVEDTIQNGVKETKSMCGKRGGRVGNTIQNGVRHTEDGDWLDGDERFEDIIKDGVKNLGAVDYDNLKHVEGIIENGVKETYDDCSNNIARVEGIIRIGEKIS